MTTPVMAIAVPVKTSNRPIYPFATPTQALLVPAERQTCVVIAANIRPIGYLFFEFIKLNNAADREN